MVTNANYDGDGSDDDDLQFTKFMGTLAYGVCDQVDAFLRLGIAQVEGNDVVGPDDDIEFGGNDFYWGAGCRATLFETEQADFGCVVTVSETKSEEANDYDGVEFYTIQVAAGAAVPLSDIVTAYGGAVWQHINGEWATSAQDDGTMAESGDMTEDGLGAYAGAQFQVSEAAAISAEIIFTENSIAAAFSFFCDF